MRCTVFVRILVDFRLAVNLKFERELEYLDSGNHRDYFHQNAYIFVSIVFMLLVLIIYDSLYFSKS